MLIAIDHGNKQVKTVHGNAIVSGVQKSKTRPYGRDVLKYGGSYYTLSAQRIPYQKDKTADERFFILSLFAIAEEIEAQGAYTSGLMPINLAIGLPPAHFGAQNKAFVRYFKRKEPIYFSYRDKLYSILIRDVQCYPQAFAAAAMMLGELATVPRALILDVGGFTADYLLLKNGRADLSTCDSLENGVILLYNRIRSKASSDLDILLEETDVDAILLQGQGSSYGEEVAALVEYQAQEFVNDMLGALRERQLDLRTGRVIFVGGGACLLQRQIEASGKVAHPVFVEDVNANAKFDNGRHIMGVHLCGFCLLHLADDLREPRFFHGGAHGVLNFHNKGFVLSVQGCLGVDAEIFLAVGNTTHMVAAGCGFIHDHAVAAHQPIN